MSQFDYTNPMLSGIPKTLINIMQNMKNQCDIYEIQGNLGHYRKLGQYDLIHTFGMQHNQGTSGTSRLFPGTQKYLISL